ncbi:MAG: hypothetical protein IT370_36275 [Deltaproteobacteria bacterium]|nr:hypothetical protein [Deltaproteobacteria bacterium]
MIRGLGVGLVLVLALTDPARAQAGGTDPLDGADGQFRGPGETAPSPLRLGAGPPSVKLAPPGLLRGQDRAAVERFLPRLRDCYRRVLEQQPGKAGAGVATLHVAADGRVTDVKVVGLEWLRGCLNGLRTVRFPPDDGARERDLELGLTVAPPWPAEVDQAFASKRDDLLACMDRNPGKPPRPQVGGVNLPGPTTVTVTFTITAKGKLSGVSARSPTASAAARCVSKVVRKLIITLPDPAPRKLTVSYPIDWVAPSRQPHPTMGGSP